MKHGRLSAKCLELAGVKSGLASVELPIPPTANSMYNALIRRNRERKQFVQWVMSAEYKAWLVVAKPILSRLASPLRYPCEIVFTVGKCNEGRDLDNMLKPLGDAIRKSGVLKEDNIRHVRKWTVEYLPNEVPETMVEVRIVEAERSGADLLDFVE